MVQIVDQDEHRCAAVPPDQADVYSRPAAPLEVGKSNECLALGQDPDPWVGAERLDSGLPGEKRADTVP